MTDLKINEHPDYCDGFFDAIDGEPLFDDSSAEYAAGWYAWWEVKDVVDSPGFLKSWEATKLPSSPTYPFHAPTDAS